MTALLTDPQLIHAELERRLEELRAASPITAQKAQLERELRRTKRAIHRLVEAYQEELIALDELRRRTPELRKKAASLYAHFAQSEQPFRSIVNTCFAHCEQGQASLARSSLLLGFLLPSGRSL